jgi:hypothetical protein
LYAPEGDRRRKGLRSMNLSVVIDGVPQPVDRRLKFRIDYREIPEFFDFDACKPTSAGSECEAYAMCASRFSIGTMNFRLTTLIAAALVVACSSSARAGFLTVDSLVVAEFDKAASSAPVDDTPAPPIPWVQQLQRKALANAPAGSGMTGAAGLSGSSHASAAALPMLPPDTPAQLSARVRVAERAWLPPPFSTGIFRPPRG